MLLVMLMLLIFAIDRIVVFLVLVAVNVNTAFENALAGADVNDDDERDIALEKCFAN